MSDDIINFTVPMASGINKRISLDLDISLDDIDLLPKGIEKAIQYAVYGLTIDGEHHKQWCIERLLQALGMNLKYLEKYVDGWEEGIAP